MISISSRRCRGVLLFCALLCGILAPAIQPALAQDDSGRGFSGLIQDSSGKPVEGFRLVFRDAAGQEHTTEPSDDLGRYAIDLAPGSYQLVAAMAPDGTRLEVPSLPVLPVDSDSRRLDIRIGQPGKPSAPRAKAGSGTPWVQIGAATGTFLVLWLAVWDDDKGEQSASPFVP